MSDKPELVGIRVELNRLIALMQKPKDIHVVMGENGLSVATCKQCQQVLLSAIKDDLHWYKCPQCERLSFAPVVNLERDAHIAKTMGGTFEYEICFFRDLPPQMQAMAPTEWA